MFKRILGILLIGLLVSIGFKAEANHVMGADLTYEYLGNNGLDYRFTLKVYRDCSGATSLGNCSSIYGGNCENVAPASCGSAGDPIIHYRSRNCGNTCNVYVTSAADLVSMEEVTPLCLQSSSTCDGGPEIGVEEWIYVFDITLDRQCDDWEFVYATFARNGSITTIDHTSDGGTAVGFSITARLNNTVRPYNSSPTFENLAVPFLCKDEEARYNPGTAEKDGDRLEFSLQTPKIQDPRNNIAYVGGRSREQPFHSNPPIVFNSDNGQIRAVPDRTNNAILTLQCDEFRNGTFVGSVQRDVQAFILDCSGNDSPEITLGGGGENSTATLSDGTIEITLCGGKPNDCIEFNMSDGNGDQTITASQEGNLPGNSSFNINNNNTSTPQGVFCWQPGFEDISNVPYQFSVILEDDNCPFKSVQQFGVIVNVILCPDTIQAEIEGTDQLCVNQTGTIEVVNIQDTVEPIAFNWSTSGNPNPPIPAPNAGPHTIGPFTQTGTYSYFLTVTDAVGNIPAVVRHDVEVVPTPVANFFPDGEFCAGIPQSLSDFSQGSIEEYIWDFGDGNTGNGAVVTHTYATPGNYNVTLRTTSGGGFCFDEITKSITVHPGITLSDNITDVACAGESTGAIDIEVLTGNGGYQYNWGGGITTQDRMNLPAGTYNLNVTDNQGCSLDESYEVKDINPPLTAAGVVTDATCQGQADGNITVTVNGGAGGNTYMWSDGTTTTKDLTNAPAGTYTVTVTDQLGCTVTETQTINEPAGMDANPPIPTNVLCFGEATGSIDITVTGGNGGYTYQWDNGAPNIEDPNNLSAGNYSVTVTDSKGCNIQRGPVSVTEPPLLELLTPPSTTPASCFNTIDGTISIDPTGGTQPYTFTWDGPSLIGNVEDPTGILPGTYYLTITDNNNCEYIDSALVASPDSIVVDTIYMATSCTYLADGEIEVIASGGTSASGNYSYAWSHDNTETTNRVTGLAPGVYTSTVSDDNNCQAFTDVTIEAAPPVIIDSVVTDVVCNGTGDGAIDIEATGGTEANTYGYAWSNGSTQEDLTGLLAGTYTVTVTDDNNCTFAQSHVIEEPAELILTTSNKIDVACFNESTGQFDVNVTGGTGPYQVSFNGGAPSATFTASITLDNLPAGNYNLQVTDARNCIAVGSITLNQPAGPIVDNENVNNLTCFQSDDGSITLTPTGGTGPNYTFNWVDGDAAGQTTATVSNLSAGGYQVEITDQNQCVQTFTIAVTEPNQITGDVTETGAPSVTCNGGADGELCISNIAGGTGNANGFAVAWFDLDNGNALVDNGNCATNHPAGNYRATITDDNNCTGDVDATITEPAVLDISVTNFNGISCNGFDDGTITTASTGGTTPYNFDWGADNPSGGPDNWADFTPGNKTVTITDDRGCTDVAGPVNIVEPTVLGVNISNQVDVLCRGDATGRLTAAGNGGTPGAGYTYVWERLNPNAAPNISTDANANGLIAGTYQVEVTDANGCTETTTAVITEPAEFVGINTVAQQNPQCNTINNGFIEVAGTGGVGNFTYSWSNGATTARIDNLGPGTYDVVVRDGNNCDEQMSFTLTVPQAIQGNPAQTDPTCFGFNNGIIDNTPLTGVRPFQFYENTQANAIAETRNDLVDGTYNYTVEDANGCTRDFSITLTEPTALEIEKTIVPVTCINGEDGSINVTASGGTNPIVLTWSNGAPDQSLNDNLQAGVYNVTVGDANGCPIENDATAAGNVLTIQVPYKNEPLLVNDEITSVRCFGESSGKVILTAVGGAGNYSYEWSDGSTEPSQLNATAGNYSVTVTDADNCQIKASYDIDEPSKLSVLINTVNATCETASDGSVEAIAQGGNGSYVYDWDAVGSNGPQGIKPVVDNLTIGKSGVDSLAVGLVTLTVKDTLGCTLVEEIFVGDDDKYKIVAGDIQVRLGQTGQIEATVPGGFDATEWRWTDDDINALSCLDCPNPIVDIVSPRHFIVRAEDPATGCIDEHRVYVDVAAFRKIYVPNIFTPTSGDENSTFFAQGDWSIVKNFKMKVFNRWGNMVYSSIDPLEKWDGAFNGQMVPTGVYTYFIEVEFIDNYELDESHWAKEGSITILY